MPASHSRLFSFFFQNVLSSQDRFSLSAFLCLKKGSHRNRFCFVSAVSHWSVVPAEVQRGHISSYALCVLMQLKHNRTDSVGFFLELLGVCVCVKQRYGSWEARCKVWRAEADGSYVCEGNNVLQVWAGKADV